MSLLLNPGLVRTKTSWQDWSLILTVIVLPLSIVVFFATFPPANLHFEDHWFHFEVVSFVCLTGLVLGVATIVLLGPVLDPRALFIPLGLGAIAGIFLIHGLATPGVLEVGTEHQGHTVVRHFFARPDLAVAWSAPISLVTGACFFALAAVRWSDRRLAQLRAHRRALLLACALLYALYAVIAVALPDVFEFVATLAPASRYLFAILAAALYLFAAWRFWQAYRSTHRRLDAGLAASSLLLCEALVPMLALPTWTLGWWTYHVLMLVAFVLALSTVVFEYERVQHFQLTTYFAAVSVIATAVLAFMAGDFMTQLVAAFVPALVLNLVRWGATVIFGTMAAFLFCALLLVVRRGDTLLRENSLRLQQQQAALERGRIAEALVPIGVAIGGFLNTDKVLDMICRESHRLFQVDTALLWYREGDELFARAAYGTQSEGFLGMRQPIRNNPLLGARVVREQRPIYENHAMTSRGVHAEIVKQFGIQSILGVPLVGENETLGALVLMDLENPERFGSLDLEVARLFAQQAAQALTHARLYERIQLQADALKQALGDLRATYGATLTALSAALDARDRETEGHSRRVTAYALLLADALGIYDAPTRDAIEWGALLHDVGKIGVPDAILHKPAALTESEWVLMRQHPDIGHEILQKIPFLQPAFAIVRHHHESWNGTGYPLQLRGEEIPLPARIFALADALDAMTTDRPYRKAMDFERAASEILRQRGQQFDPAVVDVFARIPLTRWQQVAGQIQGETSQGESWLVKR